MSAVNVWGCNLETDQHRCGSMPGRLSHRCLAYATAYAEVEQTVSSRSLSWWNSLKAEATGLFKRPRNCIHKNKLIIADEDNFPYIAVSYVWEINPQRPMWEGRRVTSQALAIAERLSKHTILPLWIDAICIHQDDEAVKMVELAKMADIYRGAVAVLCLIPEMQSGISKTVSQSIEMMKTAACQSLEENGHLYGNYMFATLGANGSLQDLYGSRWWTRAWTYQEAILNSRTYLIGPDDDTIPIAQALQIALCIRRYAATMPAESTFGQSMMFWDSTASMVEAASRALPLGDAMACVWRRDATIKHDLVYALLGVCRFEQIIPDYKKLLNDVLINLVEYASMNGDYSWISWCHTIPSDVEEGMCLVPTPDNVRSCTTTSISKLISQVISPFPPTRISQNKGVQVPYRSTGIVRWCSPPQNLTDTVTTLEKRGFGKGEVWDMLFGLHIGLAADIEAAIGASGMAEVLLRMVLLIESGTFNFNSEYRDMPGTLPYMQGYAFMNYIGTVGQCWKDTLLVIAESQGGVAVIPANSVDEDRGKKARLHILPVELKHQRSVVIFVYDEMRFHVSGIGIMVEKQSTGKGSWQSCRFGGTSATLNL
ncbi:hypothetical protein K435DRAFT_969446 [Dendrothele bispora CBS 962.96]|uniref:Heterokaryon incompatibility domain-containing protein n=1 Tax=Dendrothele bispora (strain CBS 962.96) TaxID=1314807 RepID=A0A4S8LHN2_DENBC|nr:hypothetical protein K435DRAFT_969446 [Dendrothele bispora CBS 962.96]